MPRTGRPKAELSLAHDEREQLLRWSRRARSSQALALRSKIVLSCAEGLDNKSVAAKLGCAEATVSKWRRRFVAKRLDGLLDEARPGGPRSISDEQIEQVLVATLERTPKDATHWSRASMAAEAGLDRSTPVLPMMPGMPERRTHDYLRSGTTTLFAALDVATGQVIGSLHRRRRAIEFKKFLIKIDNEVPAEMDVHLICDNLSTHKTPAITAWLDAHPRFHMHFTPTSSSWLNQVERWFSLLTDKQLRRGVHKNIQALEKDIRAWITTWNDNPRPFAWTKTADEILERLASYIQRIPGAGH